MPSLLPDVDPGGLLEYSVVYTDRALNHMSRAFQGVMTDISATLKRAYGARSAIIVPGSGTFGMEAVARQFATDRSCLILRNGWFSYRWSQILDTGRIAGSARVLAARQIGDTPHAPFAPAPLDEVLAAIHALRPSVVFAPHVETASGLLLPEDYLRAIAAALHERDGLLVLDCIASGAIWVDMAALGVDVLISAPQKGWSGSPCCAFVMLGEHARAHIDTTASSSFACDLRKWMQIMEVYEGGGAAYHSTMPTDALTRSGEAMRETEQCGFEALRAAQLQLGARVRALLTEHGYASVAAPGFEAPGVVVSYTDDAQIQSGRKFADLGLQIAAGVPLQCGEAAEFRSFRVGLFGLEKLRNVDRTVALLADALARIG